MKEFKIKASHDKAYRNELFELEDALEALALFGDLHYLDALHAIKQYQEGKWYYFRFPAGEISAYPEDWKNN